MFSFSDTPIVAAPRHLRRTAVMADDHHWTWREVHAASMALAEQFTGAPTICNLCSSRLGFIVTWLAALRRGCLQSLPPSGGHTDLVAILKSGACPLIVVDDARLLQAHWAEHAQFLVHQPRVPTTGSIPDAALAWSPNWDAPLICLYTSGSTGAPEPQTKTLGQLTLGARVLAAGLDEAVPGGIAALQQIVSSVPPQHMFGVETSVMLPLVTGLPVLDRRPLLAADVQAAFEEAEGDGAWIATPLHLSALARSNAVVPRCRLVLVSTMPLAPALAERAEVLACAPVMEIYGSTETGVVAMRRTARQPAWRPVDGVRIQPSEAGAMVWGAHFASPSQLPDQIEPDAEGGFKLLGRQSDLIKIGGRRASLAGLNLLLQDLPGLTDGVFYLPSSGLPTERLVLIYAGAPLDRDAARRWLRERMDPAFLPRSIIEVERLPRTDAGKLARAALDEIYESKSRSRVNTPMKALGFEFRIPGDHPSLAGHFPGHPVVPGVLLLDHVLRAVHRLTGREVIALKQVKFTSTLLPDETARGFFDMDGARVSFRVVAQRGTVTHPVAEGAGTLSGELIA